jgi:hypothetical protein
MMARVITDKIIVPCQRALKNPRYLLESKKDSNIFHAQES